MTSAPVPVDEEERLAALRSYEVLDTLAEDQFDALTHLAASTCGTPVALISLIDRDRQWFKSAVGLEGISQTPRDEAFCAHAILGDQVFQVADARQDVRFADNPLVTGPLQMRFYAGMPLITPAGQALGTLCVLGRTARELSQDQEGTLRQLAALAMNLLESRRLRKEAERLQVNLSEELSVARQVMARLVGQNALQQDHLRYRILPAGRFSGDVVAGARSPEGRLHMLLGDVTGHGLGSGLYLIPAMEAFYRLAEKGFTLPMIARELNRKLKGLLPVGHFMAAAIAVVDEPGRSVSLWNGGSPPVLFISAAGDLQFSAPAKHLALGILADAEFDDSVQSFTWEGPGQLWMYSDGLVEAENTKGEPLGAEAVLTVLQRTPPGERLDQLFEAVTRFTAGIAHADDVSVAVLNLAGPSPS